MPRRFWGANLPTGTGLAGVKTGYSPPAADSSEGRLPASATRPFPADPGRRDRQFPRMVRFRGLWLFCRDLRAQFLPGKRRGGVPRLGLRGLRRRLPDAPDRGRAVRPYRRSLRPQAGAPALRRADDRRDLRHRPAADLCHDRAGGALPASGPALAPGPFGGRRVRHLHRVPRGAQRPAAARPARQRRLHRRLLRHAARLRCRRAHRHPAGSGRAAGLGLARALPARHRPGRHRLRPAPRHGGRCLARPA